MVFLYHWPEIPWYFNPRKRRGTTVHYLGIFITYAPGGKLTALACHLAKMGHKAKELTNLSMNTGEAGNTGEFPE
jgi:hypothetical protein